MHWDLGLQGFAVLVVMALVFGVVVQLLFWDRALRWLWAAGAAVFAVLGLLISEVWFGWATAADLQPNIDGLSFDEVLLGLVIAVALAIGVRYVVRDRTAGSMRR